MAVWHLDVDSTQPGGVVASKGTTVRCLKSYVNWVQTVVRQVGLYLLMEVGLEETSAISTQGLSLDNQWWICCSKESK